MPSKLLGAISVLALTSSFVVASAIPSNANGTTCTVTVFDSGGSGKTLRDCIQTDIDTTADATVVFDHGDTAQTITITSTVTITGPGLTISDPDGLITITRNSDFDLFQIDLNENTQYDLVTNFVGVTLLANSPSTDGKAINGFDPDDNEVPYPVSLDSVKVTGFVDERAGGAIEAANVAVSNNSTFSNNSSTSDGGAIRAYGTLSISDSSFTGNSSDGEDGGGVAVSSGTTTVSNSSFVANTANNSRGDGGAIRVRGGTISNSFFASNTAADNGGAVYHNGNLLTIQNSLFSSNTASDGGAINARDQILVDSVSFVGNRSTDNGGAVYSHESAVVSEFRNSYFGENQAGTGGSEGDGGAIRAYEEFVATNNTFVGNTALDRGGAIRVEDDAVIALNTFLNNSTAGDGESVGYQKNTHLAGNLFLGSTSDPQVVKWDTGTSNTTPVDFGANVSTSTETLLTDATSKTVEYGSLGIGVPSGASATLQPFVPINSLSSVETFVTESMATQLVAEAGTSLDSPYSFSFPTADQQGTARTFGTTGYLPGAQFISTSTNTSFATTSDTLVATMYEIEDRSFYITDDDKTVIGDEYFYRLSTSDGTLVDLSSSAGMTGPLTESVQDFYYVSKLNYAANAYEWEWMVFFCEAANEITDSIPTITYSKQESSPAATNASYDSYWSSENWSAPQGTLETFQVFDLPDGYSPTPSSEAFSSINLADESDDQRMTISKQAATAVCPSGENAYVENLKVAGSEVSARSLDLSQDFQVNVGGLDQDIDLVGRSVAVYGVSGPFTPAAAHFGITTIVQGQSVSATPAPYSGPVVTRVGSSAGAFQALGGQNVTVYGERLSTVSKVFVDGLEGEVISTSADSFVMTVPTGLSAGTHDLVIESSLGNLTYLDALMITASVGTTCTGESMSYWTTRISDTQAKVYIKCPELDAKIRILHQTGGSGEYEVPFVKTITSLDDSSLVVNEFGTYIVRTIDLEEINRIRIRIDDQEVWKVRYNR